MNTKISYNYTEHCPYLGKEHTITIKSFEIQIGSSIDYKKDTFYCNCINECPEDYRDEYGRCPVYLNAPNNP